MQLKERCINIPTNSKNTLMKKIFLIAMAIITLTLSAQSQAYRDSRYYNNSTGRLEYTYHHHDGVIGTGDVYYGLRLGPAFSTVNSDDKALDGGDSQTGLNLGAVIGFGLSDTTPLFLETGLFYVEKGGKNVFEGKKMTYDLNYLQIPIVAKYVIDIDGDFSVQPFFGGYLACGVGGKIKNYGDRQSESSFSHKYFQRFDGGLRIGCGAAYDMFYVDLGYDIGLSNITHDEFDASHNRCWTLSLGVNF